MRVALVVGLLVACGSDDAEPIHLAGSPDATRALAFTARGTPVAIGGTNAFGLMYLQHQDGERWVRAAGVPAFGSAAQLIGGGGRPLYALSDTTLYALDETTMTWTATVMPAGPWPGTVFGTDTSGLVYALDVGTGQGDSAVVAWMPGATRWYDVAATRPTGNLAAPAVGADGRVAWLMIDTGIVEVADGMRTLLVDCTGQTCAQGAGQLTFAASGTLTFRVCADDGGPPVVMRVEDAGVTELPTPADATSCGDLTTAADGSSLLASSYDGAVWRVAARGATWSRVASAEPGMRYVLRDQATAFAIGDPLQGVHGLYRLDL